MNNSVYPTFVDDELLLPKVSLPPSSQQLDLGCPNCSCCPSEKDCKNCTKPGCPCCKAPAEVGCSKCKCCPSKDDCKNCKCGCCDKPQMPVVFVPVDCGKCSKKGCCGDDEEKAPAVKMPVVYVPVDCGKCKGGCCSEKLTTEDEVYKNAANWDTCRYPSISNDNFLAIRLCINMVQFGLFAVSCATHEFTSFAFYFSVWGQWVTMVASILCIKATLYKGDGYLKSAMIGTQFSHAINVTVTPIFVYYAQTWEWSKFDTFTFYYMIVTHFLPIASSTSMIVLTDMQMIKDDWKKVVVMGYCYVFVNFCGVHYTGLPMYAPIDWINNPERAFGYSSCFVAVMAALYYVSAHIMETYLPRRKD